MKKVFDLDCPIVDNVVMIKNDIKLGFTGSQRGMSVDQMIQLEALVKRLHQKFNVSEFHHGGCIGADTEASHIIKRLEIWTACHPPINKSKVGLFFADEVFDDFPYSVRNKNIVDNSTVLIGIPFGNREILRSGTWSTVRYARTQEDMIIYLIYSNGFIEIEGDEDAG